MKNDKMPRLNMHLWNIEKKIKKSTKITQETKTIKQGLNQ